jgi:hypothetical protein
MQRKCVDGVFALAAVFALCATAPMWAQRGFGGGPGGFGGGPGGMGQSQKILKTYDKDNDGYLNAEERKAARADRGVQRGGRGGFGGGGAPSQPGPKLSPADVKPVPGEPLYTMKAVRTFFLQFENDDWEQELASFNNTDVDVPATLIVDGQTYRDVGVHFRGNTSYMGVGMKNSLNLSIDFKHKNQRLMGYRTLNLMNSASDPTMMRIALYHEIARQYFPAPKANWVRVAINGESWGVYVNLQQINSDFTEENFKSTKGARWKLPVNMGGGSGFSYLGDDPERYKRAYEIKSKDDPKAWADLVNFCKILNNTPADKLEQALEPVLDIDGALKYLALDKATINNDGYWVRASDFMVYQDPSGRFHAIPADANETFSPAEGGRGGFGGGGGGVQLDPFAGAQDSSKPLLSRLMAVPALRQRYLRYLRDIAANSLDWGKMGPKIAGYQALLDTYVKEDTRNLSTYQGFLSGVGLETTAAPAAAAPQENEFMRGPGGFGGRGGRRGGGASISLKSFFDQRRAFLLEYPEIKALAPAK